MIVRYFVYLYYKIKGYLYLDNNNNQYKIPFDKFSIPKHKNINNTIFALNNMPETIHQLLFGNNGDIAFNYYYIRLDLQKNMVDHNLALNDDMLNNDIKYIFIRLNLINNNSLFNHVNGIYINKNKKYILIYEPKVELMYDSEFIETLLKSKIDCHDYIFIYAEDLGYSHYKRMQNYDLFCQTYVLFVFVLITLNDDINYENYSDMFDSVINSNNIDHFLYYIDELLKNNNYDICEQPELWTIPNIMKCIFKKDNNNNDNVEKLVIKEDDDIFIIDQVNNIAETDDVDLEDCNLGCNNSNVMIGEDVGENPPNLLSDV